MKLCSVSKWLPSTSSLSTTPLVCACSIHSLQGGVAMCRVRTSIHSGDGPCQGRLHLMGVALRFMLEATAVAVQCCLRHLAGAVSPASLSNSAKPLAQLQEEAKSMEVVTRTASLLACASSSCLLVILTVFPPPSPSGLVCRCQGQSVGGRPPSCASEDFL